MLALDIPSGLDADTGTGTGPVVQATHTATFIALKPGLLTADGVDAAGKVTLHDLGIDAGGDAAAGRFLTWPAARAWLRSRQRNTHKGSFGTLGIVGGAGRNDRRASAGGPRRVACRRRQGSSGLRRGRRRPSTSRSRN